MYLKVECNRHGLDKLSNIRHQKYNHIEFIHMLSNGGSVLAGSHILPIVKGAVFIIDSSEPHCTAPKNPEVYLRNCLTIDRPSFEAFVAATGLDSVIRDLYRSGVFCAVCENDSIDRISSLFSELSELVKAGAPDPDKYFVIFRILMLLRDSGIASDRYPEDKSTVARALDYIEHNALGGIGTAEIAKALHVNKHYLCHAFKNKTGITLTEYILNKRLGTANELLSDRKLSIGEIAARVGFSSESYFICKYRERYGISPGKKRSEEQKSKR